VRRRGRVPARSALNFASSGALAARRNSEGTFGVQSRPGLGDPGHRGHLFVAAFGMFDRIVDNDGHPAVVVAPDKKHDAALYVQDDGVVYMLTRFRGATAWVKDTHPIKHFSGIPVTDAVLERVTPGYIW